jgi:hypothetical protein
VYEAAIAAATHNVAGAGGGLEMRYGCSSALLNSALLLEELAPTQGAAGPPAAPEGFGSAAELAATALPSAARRYRWAAAAAAQEHDLPNGILAARRYQAVAWRGADGSPAGDTPGDETAELHALLGRVALTRPELPVPDAGDGGGGALLRSLAHTCAAFALCYPAGLALRVEAHAKEEVSRVAGAWAAAAAQVEVAEAGEEAGGAAVRCPWLTRQVAWLSYGLAVERAGLMEVCRPTCGGGAAWTHSGRCVLCSRRPQPTGAPPRWPRPRSARKGCRRGRGYWRRSRRARHSTTSATYCRARRGCLRAWRTTRRRCI